MFFKKFPFGLDISDYSIEILELERKFGISYLRTYGRVKLEMGIVEDGKILNKEKLKEKIKEVLEKTLPKKIETPQVIFSLPESKTFFHIFKFPANLNGKELTRAVENEALKTFPLDPGSYYFDFQIVSKTNDFQEVLYVGTLKEIVDEYLEVLKSKGLKPLFLDIESGSLARTFKHEMIKDGGVLIVDMGARTTNLTIVDEEFIRLSAIISIAGNHFTQAIAEKLNVSLEKAEELKKSYGIDSEKMEGKIMFILQKLLQEIFDRTRKFISFYEEKSGRKIKKILLCGGSGLMPLLSSDFASNLGIEVKLADPLFGIKNKELLTKKKSRVTSGAISSEGVHPLLFANVIGLAKRGLEKNPETAGINLIPEEKRLKPAFIGRKLNKSKIFRFLIIFLTITAFAFLGWIIYAYILRGIAKYPQ